MRSLPWVNEQELIDHRRKIVEALARFIVYCRARGYQWPRA